LGIIVCGSGIGVSIACNKVEGIRCAQCHDHYTASMARKHNDANVMSLGGRVTGVEVAYDMVSTFISEQFGQAQHTARVQKLCSSYMSQL
jgi:ribose 5-phosphate isomerase B